MDASLFISKTGLDAQQRRMSVISNNLANVSTTGFKRERAVFEDLLYQNIRQAGGQTGWFSSMISNFLGVTRCAIDYKKLKTDGLTQFQYS